MNCRKATSTLPLLICLSIVLLGCSGSAPSAGDSSPAATSPSETETSQNEDSSADPSADGENTTASESGSDEALAINRDKLIGRWQTAGGSGDAPRYVYAFGEDGSLTVTRDGDVVLDGQYEVTLEQAVRLLVRDPDSGELQPEMTLRLMVRRGEAEYVFDVEPSGNTLWLRKMTESDETSSD